MRRVLVIGSGGAGKSTFAARLAQCTGLPAVHLDAHYWRAGWVEPSREEWTRTLDALLAEPAWIMDGNYGGSMQQRLAACDTVVFLDIANWVCLWRVLVRRMAFRGRARPDMTPGCHEKLSLDFLLWILGYPWQRRPALLRRLNGLLPGQRVVRLRTKAQVEAFLHKAGAANGTGG